MGHRATLLGEALVIGVARTDNQEEEGTSREGGESKT